MKKFFILPIVTAVLFLVGAWIFFDMGETAFILYALVYAIIGITAMIISMLINKSRKINTSK